MPARRARKFLSVGASALAVPPHAQCKWVLARRWAVQSGLAGVRNSVAAAHSCPRVDVQVALALPCDGCEWQRSWRLAHTLRAQTHDTAAVQVLDVGEQPVLWVEGRAMGRRTCPVGCVPPHWVPNGLPSSGRASSIVPDDNCNSAIAPITIAPSC